MFNRNSRHSGAVGRLAVAAMVASLVSLSDIAAAQEGACCFANGACHVLTEEHCHAEGGEWQGADSTCGDATCGDHPPVGACCFDDGCHVLTEKHCHAEGGEWQGADSTCGDATCGDHPPAGACCFEDGFCKDLTPNKANRLIETGYVIANRE